jgi:hypothetical protein
MFDVFTKLFQKDNSTSFYSLYKKMIGWREADVYPFPYNLSSSISFPSDFWKDVIKIYKETRKDGRERAISVFWADGELVLTSVVKGDERSVSSSHRVNVDYIVHPTKKGYLRRKMLVDGKVVKKTDVYYKKAPKKVFVEYLFNMHTHPAHQALDSSGEEKFSYGFFSTQDINSLISSKAVITGLVTDRLWLLIRTSETPSSINLKKLREEPITIEKLKEWNIGVYEAGFKQRAVRK